MAEFGLGEYLAAEGRLIVRAENFDFEAFADTALRLVNLLSARVLEKQCDADLHTWLIDFEVAIYCCAASITANHCGWKP